jgi:hypothetical protein
LLVAGDAIVLSLTKMFLFGHSNSMALLGVFLLA